MARKKAFNLPGKGKKKHYYMYVLILQHGFRYVGVTANVDRRMLEHKQGRGSVVTKMYPPIRRETLLYLGYMTYTQAEYYEDWHTLDLMERYGYQNVRGGHYVRLHNKHIYAMLQNNPKIILKFNKDVRRMGIN